MRDILVGSRIYHMSIGEVDCTVEFENESYAYDYNRYLNGFRIWGFSKQELNSDAHIRLTVRDGLAPWADGQEPNVFINTHNYDGIEVSTRIDMQSFEGEMFLEILEQNIYTPVRVIDLIDMLICNAFMFYIYIKRFGVFIHASGIVENDAAFIFAGHSGAGKSTIAQLSESRTILSDEIVLLKKGSDGTSNACGTPFISKANAKNECVSCGGIFFIEQSANNALIPVSRLDAAVRLLQEGMLGNYVSIPEVRNIISQSVYLEILIELLQSVPCYVLQFKKDDTFWEVINEQRAKANG